MTEQTIFERARWLRDLARFLPLKSQFVLSGNVRDLQIVETAPGAFAAVPLAQAVHRELKAAEYGAHRMATWSCAAPRTRRWAFR